jgi:hypothetical protein
MVDSILTMLSVLEGSKGLLKTVAGGVAGTGVVPTLRLHNTFDKRNKGATLKK